jgi:hypothetical protein
MMNNAPASGPTPATGPPAPASQCPSCHAPVNPGQRFCGQCGAVLGGPSPPPPPPGGAVGPAGAPPVVPPDIRERVEQDRGFLKKIQLMLPGFRGYRQAEDIRAADAMLRMQVADRLVEAMRRVDDLRSDLVANGILDGLEPLGSLRSRLQRVEGQIRHAEQGYTGISPSVRITPSTLDRLYELDYTFLAGAQNILEAVAAVSSAGSARNSPAVLSAISNCRSALEGLEQTFSNRVRQVEGILQ